MKIQSFARADGNILDGFKPPNALTKSAHYLMDLKLCNNKFMWCFHNSYLLNVNVATKDNLTFLSPKYDWALDRAGKFFLQVQAKILTSKTLALQVNTQTILFEGVPIDIFKLCSIYNYLYQIQNLSTVCISLTIKGYHNILQSNIVYFKFYWYPLLT